MDSTAALTIRLLKDRFADIAARDDAAMDLGQSDDPAAHRALLECACDPDEHELVQASAGESLALIWLRRGVFEQGLLANLSTTARREAEELIRMYRPEWLGGVD